MSEGFHECDKAEPAVWADTIRIAYLCTAKAMTAHLMPGGLQLLYLWVSYYESYESYDTKAPRGSPFYSMFNPFRATALVATVGCISNTFMQCHAIRRVFVPIGIIITPCEELMVAPTILPTTPRLTAFFKIY